MITVMIVLIVAAFAGVLLSAYRPSIAPLWISVLLLCIIELLRSVPLGK